ncbi:TolC family protein [Spirosoma aerolatum]|uniref:TolC family protein n=1 Tax=Spirosoma aerolatum TaxID=1211326 RepID=UPI0009AD211A|nr:TolC family protein [Spirosoma aerolatum]
MKSKLKLYINLSIVGMLTANQVRAQQPESVSLQRAIDLALQNNRGLAIRKLQVAEKQAKLKEDDVKKYPSVTLNSTYQYNANIGSLVIDQGSFGVLPLSQTTQVPLPNETKTFALGQHHTFNAGLTAYQPITQLGKVKTGLAIDQTDIQMSEQEQRKVALQIRQAVERLYYGMLINQQQQIEARTKLDVAKLKLYDVESALQSGKTIDVSKAGLQANMADEEQNLLKLAIQRDDYETDLKRLTGIKADSLALAGIDLVPAAVPALDSVELSALRNNVDIQLASLNQQKAQLGIKAAQQSYRPDLGVLAGYTYQKGNLIFPVNNPYVGVNLKWNLQDLVANKQVMTQRNLIWQQAQENLLNTQEQVSSDLEKAYRKISQARALIDVAQKAARYRSEELKIQQDRQVAGLNLKTDLLTAQSNLAKAQVDLLSAQLNYQLAILDVKILTGTM